jgi:uridine kinase
LAQKLDYRFLDADDYFWLPTIPPYKEKRDKMERIARILGDFHAQSSCIVSGSIVSWGGELEQSFDLVIYLWIPPDIRMERLRRREIERHGKIDEEFIAWAARYDTGDMTVRSKMVHEDWMAKRRCPILRLEGDITVELWKSW